MCGMASQETNHPGLYVQAGVLMRDGKPYRGIGANYFSLFSRILRNPEDTSSLTNLTALAQARIPFVRFMCCGFWPVEQKLYLEDRESYFQQLDRVVRCAETNRIGLIPSLFWNPSTVPDIVGEHMDQLGNPDSKSIAFIRRYTGEVVRRYKDSPAIWGWEFGNEYNLSADLPNASQHRPPIAPNLGTAIERTERDEPKFEQLSAAFVAFAKTVRKFDPTRIIVSGNSLPRTAAWHNHREKKWTPDTAEQFGEILARDNPDPMDAITVHIYPEHKSGYPGGTRNLDEIVALTVKQAARAGKPLFVGEFGVEWQAGGREQQQAVFEEFLLAFERHRVPLAAFWVFDLPMQEKSWNVNFHNDRAWMIERVSQANARFHGER